MTRDNTSDTPRVHTVEVDEELTWLPRNLLSQAPVSWLTRANAHYEPLVSIVADATADVGKKFNTRDHQVIDAGDISPRQSAAMPKYFGKAGFADQDPFKTKKNGGGKGNWGNIGDEVMDEDFNFAKTRRRSNSSTATNHIREFKTKWEVNETEPVFEESLHGPEEDVDDLAKSESSENDSTNN
ncbi:uncharacterized protein DNG_00803 [Cephalotrichum gorgonifer]|uniref:Uncharacterized protein n=1 Tax=Cephalotrichum gorgonifer TaxID=2041049 RepID=A0AAE8MQ12_9PEZI|nr:uncharacterized protein DNG_00803 [Cephalotrichum gorgonifer]